MVNVWLLLRSDTFHYLAGGGTTKYKLPGVLIQKSDLRPCEEKENVVFCNMGVSFGDCFSRLCIIDIFFHGRHDVTYKGLHLSN